MNVLFNAAITLWPKVVQSSNKRALQHVGNVVHQFFGRFREVMATYYVTSVKRLGCAHFIHVPNVNNAKII